MILISANEHFSAYIPGKLKVTRIRPMVPVQNRGPLKHIRAQDVKFFGKGAVIKYGIDRGGRRLDGV